jgi:spore coat protein H
MFNLRCTWLIALFCSFNSAAYSQYFDNLGPVYPQDEVTRIEINIDPDSLNWMISTLESEHEFPAQFIFISNTFTDTVDQVGFRLRGNTSITAAKKSFKISINAFGNFKWQGLEKINLIAQHNDPSLMRSKLCHDAYRAFGVAAARTSYTELYINGEYRGLYLNAEHIDENFAAQNFDAQGDGNLYKCTYPADLAFISNIPDDYKFSNWGQRTYELQTNELTDDYSDLAHFIDVLNNTFQGNLTCELPNVFDVDSYLRQAALEILLGSWDAYIFNKNNYYLYHHQLTQQFQFMPYDLDNTLGIDWVGIDWTTRNIYGYAPSSEQRPLFKKLMLNSTYRARFSQHIESLCNGILSTSAIQSQITHWQNLISPYVENDPYYPLDYGFSFTDFNEAHTTAQGGHVLYGILPFLQARRTQALNQLESYSAAAIIPHYVYLEGLDGAYRLVARIAGADAALTTPAYSTDNVSFTELDWSADPISGDIYRSNWFTLTTASDRVFYHLTMPNGTFYPCAAPFVWTSAHAIGIHLNECMSSNATILADEFGEYNDWVELYSSSNPFWSGLYITDDSTNFDRFQIPNLNFASNPFPLIWLDDDREQGAWHTGFKLSNGEKLYLYQMEEGSPRLLDKTDVIILPADASWQRIPNGGDVTTILVQPTPRASNGGVSSIEAAGEQFIGVYPNPASTSIQMTEPLHDVFMWNAAGQCVGQFQFVQSMDVRAWASGLYLMQSREGNFRVQIERN